MAVLTLNGTDLYYETHGSGPAIVFAHGAGGNHLSWWQQVPFFRERYTCVTFDHRGFGRSVDPRPIPLRRLFPHHRAPRGGVENSPEVRPASEPPRFDEDLAALIDHLELSDVRLVAQSMGGWTCLGYAVNHPERVRALVMADTAGGLTSPALEAARAEVQARRKGQTLLGGAISEGFRRRDPRGAFLYEQILGLNPPRPPAPAGAAAINRLSVSAERAAALALPVLFIEGENDVLIPPEVIRLAQQIIPGARLQMVADAGHSVYFERPDEFNRILDAFLTEAGA